MSDKYSVTDIINTLNSVSRSRAMSMICPSVISSSVIDMYAVDTELYLSNKDLPVVEKTLQADLNNASTC